MNEPLDHEGPGPQRQVVPRAAKLTRQVRAYAAKLRPHALDIVLVIATIAYLRRVLLWQYSAYVSGKLSYHDLTLITDFFTNAIHHWRPFWITDADDTHFKTHFTPTLILLTPAFLFFQSQFALMATVAFTVAAAVFIAVREQLAGLERAGVPLYYRALLAASFFLLLALNRYTLRCIDSAHFEPVYILMATLVIAAVRRGASGRWLTAACLLALGVRQDTGLFLFFLLLSCLLAPESWPDMHRPRVAAAALGCVAYVLFATKVALPWFGSDIATRMWHSWGETWPDVFKSWVEQPEAVYQAIGNSEFLAYNAEFYFLQVIHGAAWFLNQAPSILFYTANAWDKQHLAYYNTSFLLPGMLLSLSFAQLVAAAFIRRLTRHMRLARHFGFAALTAAFVYAAVDTAFLAEREDERVLAVGELKRNDVLSKPKLRKLLRCDQIKSIATDFRTIIFVPLRFDRYLPHNALKADVVVVRRDHELRDLPYYVAPEDLRAELTQEGGYHAAFSINGYDVYVAPGLKCDGKNG